MNIVRGPQFLSVKNLDQKDKDMLIEKYKNIKDSGYVINELKQPKKFELDKMREYCDRLSKHRNFDWRKLWNDRF